MSRPIEMLARLLHKEGYAPTTRELSKKFDEPVERVMDALDMTRLIMRLGHDRAWADLPEPLTYGEETTERHRRLNEVIADAGGEKR